MIAVMDSVEMMGERIRHAVEGFVRLVVRDWEHDNPDIELPDEFVNNLVKEVISVDPARQLKEAIYAGMQRHVDGSTS